MTITASNPGAWTYRGYRASYGSVADVLAMARDKVISEVSTQGYLLTVYLDDGGALMFDHAQSCCEDVHLEDGHAQEVAALVGGTVYRIEFRTEEPDLESIDLVQWTFVEFTTSKGSATIRFVGASNGYYGVDVDVAFDDSVDEEDAA